MVLDNILVVGKSSETNDFAQKYSNKLFAADQFDDAWEILKNSDPQAVLVDHNIPYDQICEFLKDIKKHPSNLPVIVMGDKNHCDKLMRYGAFDYINDSANSKKMSKIIAQITNTDTEIKVDQQRFFSEDCPGTVSIVGKSKATEHALRMIHTVANSSCNPVLIIGETGTGKELAARAVHIIRHGSDRKFVALNCAALTANLLESELFGHVKGSFTSADRDKTGLLELAGEGTIFLDEISEMPLDLQAKLLRVVQEKTFRKVGGTKYISCRATIVATSNQNLYKAVEQNKFRRDLYYRLAICPIILSPLRIDARKDDILLLAEYFIKTSRICPEKIGKIAGLTKLAQETLIKHNWPGNVRELKNVIDRAIMLETSDKIGSRNLLINPEENMEPYQHPSVGLKDFSLERAEKELVAKALQEAGWQKTRAAALLGITRATLYAKVKQYNITEPPKNTAPVAV